MGVLPAACSNPSPLQGQDGVFTIRVVAQKVNADGRIFLLREIYGIERKVAKEGEAKPADEDEDDSERECVVSCWGVTKVGVPTTNRIGPPGLHVRGDGHDGVAVQTPVPVQQLRRGAALPGQQVPHLPRSLPLAAQD